MSHAGPDGAHAQHPEDLDGLGGEAQEELDRDEIQDHAHRPGDPVLGSAEPPRAVVRLHLDDGDPHPAGDGRDEPVHLAVQAEVFDHLAAVRLERAAVVVEPDAGHLGDEPVGQQGGQAPAEEPVLSVLPPPADDVVVRGQREEAGDVRGVVLQVPVQRHDDLAPGVIEPRRERRRLPEVPAERHQDPAGVRRPDRFQAGPGPVRGAVVHGDDLVGDALRVQGAADLVGEDGDVLLLVEDGDDDGQGGAVGLRHGVLLSTRRRAARGNPRNSRPR